MENERIPEGHFSRLRDKIFSLGAKKLTGEEYIEYLLHLCIPRKDTKPLAKALLKKFGKADKVVSAPRSELLKIDGVGDTVCALFALVADYPRRALDSAAEIDLKAAEEILLKLFAEDDRELVAASFYDDEANYIKSEILSEGDVTSAKFSTENFVERSRFHGAKTVVLGHNHPGGSTIPSNEDIFTTKSISSELAKYGVSLAEHYIFAGGKIGKIIH